MWCQLNDKSPLFFFILVSANITILLFCMPKWTSEACVQNSSTFMTLIYILLYRFFKYNTLSCVFEINENWISLNIVENLWRIPAFIIIFEDIFERFSGGLFYSFQEMLLQFIASISPKIASEFPSIPEILLEDHV